jgi:hypothetical protein
MKKVFMFVFLSICLVLLAGCRKNPDPDPTEEEKIDLQGMEFVIMVDTPARQDPRTDQYERLYQAEKAQKIADVEAKYNVKVVYKAYPSSAPWGTGREKWVINQNVAGDTSVHIYEFNSTSIPILAQAGAISKLTGYIDKYINKETNYFPEKEGYTKFKGDIYGYDDLLNLAEHGIYYNIDLLGQILGEENNDLPSRLWLNNEWNWEKFEEMITQIKQWTDAQTDSYYALGGAPYNWAYQFAGANGLALVDNSFQLHLTDSKLTETLEFLANIKALGTATKPIWAISQDLSNTCVPEFAQGNVVFHDGESWYLTMSNRWLKTDTSCNFDIGFVPFPSGPNTVSDLSNYYVSGFSGQATYVISSAFDKSKIPAGYENLMIHDETIFRIWADLQYFSPNGRQSFANKFINGRAELYYGSDSSIEAHRSVLNKLYPEYWYYMDGTDAQTIDGCMLKIKSAIDNPGTARTTLEGLQVYVAQLIYDQFGIEQVEPLPEV